jgi:lipopolysaccharide export system protein LptA
MALVVAALVGLYLFGRAGQTGMPRQGEREEEDDTPRGEITLVGEGFEFTHTEGDRPVFRIRGEAVRADRGGTVYLDGVGLTLYNEAGEGYDISSQTASFNRETRAADLEGDVELRGPRNASLSARGIKLTDRGRTLESVGEVRFTFQGLSGRADRLRVARDNDVYVLDGDVQVDSLPDAETQAGLRAGRLVFERARHALRAVGGVSLRRDGDVVEAARINAFLDDTDTTVLFMRARFQVTGRLTVDDSSRAGLAATASGGDDAGAPASRVLRFSGRSLSVLRNLGGLPQTAELEGAPAEPAVVESPTGEGTVQRLVAGYLLASFNSGSLTSVRAFNGPKLLEVKTGAAQDGELRSLDGRRLEGRFAADGRLVSLTAEEAVHYADEEVTASGDEAVYDVLEDKAELTGKPVRLLSDRGELLAPRVSYERTAGVVFAQEGVRAVAEDASEIGLDGTPLGQGKGPVRVESTEALWRDEPRSALFRGDVRAWRGENLLLAQALRADETAAGDRLVASGGVRSVWIPAAPEPGGESADGMAADGPVEVTANTLTYERLSAVLLYEGRVRAEQGERDLACRELEVVLAEGGGAERLTCTGDAVLNDRPAGTTARGEQAVYDLPSRKVTMLGDPVKLTKNDGAQVEGARVLYDLATGTARVVTEGPVTEQPAMGAPADGEPPAPGTGDPSTGAVDGGEPAPEDG